MAPKKKPAQEARERLSEKVADIRLKSDKLHALINNITELPITRAEEVLKEKSKTKFLAKYSKVSTELEGCINQLLLVTDAISSLDDSDDEAGENDESEDENDDSDYHDSLSVITNSTTINLERMDSEETKCNSHESLTSIVTSASVDTYHRSVSQTTESPHNSIPNDVSFPDKDPVLKNPSAVENTVSIPKSEITKAIPSPPVGDNAHSETKHASPTVNGMSKEEVKIEDLFPVLTDVTVESFKWEPDVPYPVIVVYNFTPMNFHVQIVNPENDIMEQLCMHFLEEAAIGYYGGINYVPSPDTFCCAKSTSNGPWYRARVVSIHNEPKDASGNIIMDQVLVKVFFIDEGYEDNVILLHMRPLYNQFSKLPAQSIRCILGGVQPIEAAAQTKNLSFSECNEMWLPDSISFFETLVKNGNICTAYFYIPPSISYQPPHNVSQDTLVCDIYVVNTGSKVAWWKMSDDRLPIEDHIAFKMIVNKMAAHCPFFSSELSHKNSMRILEQYLKPETAVFENERIVNTVMKQENVINLKELNHSEVKNEDVEEYVPLPSSKRLEFNRAKSEDGKEIKVSDTKLRGSFDENMNSNQLPGNDVHSTLPLKLSPSQKEIVPEKEINERRSHVIKNDPRWPADEKPASTKNEKFFPSKKTPDVNPSTPARSDIQEEDTSVIHTKKSPDTSVIHVKNLPTSSQSKNYKFGSCFKETILTPEPESGFAKVLVSEVINPSLFYVHLVTEEVVLLDKLTTELNIYYKDKASEILSFSKSIGHKYEIGNAIVVLYSADQMWYRALILSVRLTADIKYEYEVLFVDFGSGEWISEDYVLPIIEKFCELPMEIIACSLADVKPCSNLVTKQVKGVCMGPAGFETHDYDSDNSQTNVKNMILKWPQQAIDRLKNVILTQLPLMVSLKNVFKNSDGVYEVYLFDTADNKDVFINQLLVDEGLASSDVLTKITPSVQVSEVELEKKVAEENAMAEWDPMKEEYFSNRNVYSVNTDDPGVASLGVVQPKKNPCNNFIHRGYCYRGDNCKFVHAHPGDPIYDSVEVFCDDTILELPKAERCVPVVIRALLDPTHFWVNFPFGVDWDDDTSANKNKSGDEALEKLHQQMNLYYSKLGHSRKTNLSLLAEGELIAAKFHQDDQWYRARVINTADDLVQVFYVDYGNTDVITEDKTNMLLPDFLHLPFQAVECFLFNTYLEEDLTSQDDKFVEVRIKFRDMVADKVLMAYVVSSSITNSIVVMLYDTTTDPHTYINEVIRDWDGIIHKAANDIDTLKDCLWQGSDAPSQKISFIPG